jgi:hypothetical protein
MRKLTCEPGTDVSGASLVSLIENVHRYDIAPLVEKYGFEEIDPDGWYPLSEFQNLLTDLVTHPNQAFNLVAIGMGIAQYALMPPGFENMPFEQWVKGWNDHYQTNFRNGPVGEKTAVRVGNQHYKVIHEGTTMPDDLEYGVLYGFAKRLLPRGTSFTVWYDENIPRMDDGGNQTVLHVKWT